MVSVPWATLLAISAAKAILLNNAQAISQANAITSNDSISGISAFNNSIEASAASLWNTSAFSVSLNDTTDVTYRCNGDHVGFNIAASSCFNAITGSIFEWQDPNRKTWGPRHTGVRYDYLLPQRLISREGFFRLVPDIAPLTKIQVTEHA